jgi:signal transduction histidine kinase
MSSELKPKLFKNATFRLALVYMVLFSLSVMVLLGFIYWNTAGYMIRQTEAAIEAEIAALSDRYDQAGLQGLSALISKRIRRQVINGPIYLLTDKDYRPILGNLGEWPEGQELSNGWMSFGINPVQSDDESEDPHTALVRIFTLRGSYRLMVGRDVHDLVRIRQLFRDSLIWGVLLTGLLALIGGVMMSRTMMRRIEMINDTCQRIMQGDLALRIPLKGNGDDFDRLIDNLNQMLDRIGLLMDGISQVTNNIAHDLRTPLTRLRRRLDTLREVSDPCAETHALLEQTIDEADGLLATFRSMLRISEVESGRRRAGFKAVDMCEVLNDLVEFYEPLCEDKRQLLKVELLECRPISGDRDLLFQALANVLDNAIKYTPRRGRIALSLAEAEQELVVSVADSGPGVPAELRGRVFERFYRLEASRSTPGNGLGLALVEAIVTLHQGRIELADNQPGLKVIITLPRNGPPVESRPDENR